MLHSLPALLDELERTLIQGEDPMPLISAIRWSEIVDWPKDNEKAGQIRQKIERIGEIITALYSPLRATILALGSDVPYKAKCQAELPKVFTSRIEAQA
ncbi:MAG: hypothetical protein FWG02_01065 [Holophagaceae bacterium]|nr:hypothetical protein [Holophagaceae bacterium]